jgi:hypothetical protein
MSFPKERFKLIKRSVSRFALCFFLAATALSSAAYSCSLIEGSFYQVTRLRGTVVGVEDRDFRHPIRWLRQQEVRGDLRLSLHTYRSALKNPSETRPCKSITTNKDGAFDFGVLPVGHYTLFVEAPWGTDRFDVQITQLSRQTESIMIDVSPVYPDCTGGHEFIVRTK